MTRPSPRYDTALQSLALRWQALKQTPRDEQSHNQIVSWGEMTCTVGKRKLTSCHRRKLAGLH